jgi:hypothetical protein
MADYYRVLLKYLKAKIDCQSYQVEFYFIPILIINFTYFN